MTKRASEISAAVNLIEADCLVQDLRKVITRLESLADLVEAREKAREKAFRECLSDCWAALRKIQADSELLVNFFNLMTRQDTGEDKWQKSENGSSPDRLLEGFAKRTR